MKSKRGNIPITILVLGIFGVCALALLTFFVSDFEVSNSFVGASVLHQVNSDMDEYMFYKNQGAGEERLDSYFNITKEGEKKYIYEEKRTTGWLSNEEVLFSVRYTIPS